MTRLLLALLALATPVFAATPIDGKAAAEAKLIETVKRAFETNDAKLLLTMFCWDRVPDSGRMMISNVVAASMRGNKIIEVKLVPPPADFLDTKEQFKGVTFKPNLSILHQLVVMPDPASGQGVMKFPVGEKSGQLLIANMAPAK